MFHRIRHCNLILSEFRTNTSACSDSTGIATEIGRELTTVKERLEHGQFLPWIASEFDMSERTAYNLMSVSDRFGDKFATVANLSTKILYALAAPSTPEQVIEQAIEKATTGEKVTVPAVDCGRV